MSHSAVSRSRRRDFMFLSAPSRPCGHQALRYPFLSPIVSFLCYLRSRRRSIYSFFHTAHSPYDLHFYLRCLILFSTISGPFTPYLRLPLGPIHRLFYPSPPWTRRISFPFRSPLILSFHSLSTTFTFSSHIYLLIPHLPSHPTFTLIASTRRFGLRYY
jgi:hypothetical protein